MLAWVSVAVVLVVFSVVAMRYGLQRGSIALQETGLYLHALLFMAGIAYTLRHDAHVRVDIFYRQMSARGKAWVDLCGTLLFLLPFSLFVLWISADYVSASWRLGERSREAGGLPGLYLVKSLIPLMAALLLMQGVSQALKAIAVLRGHQHASEAAPTTPETGL